MHADEQARDARWVRAVQQGDAEAFGAMAEAYYTGLFDAAACITRDPRDAEDVVQDVLLHVWAHHRRWAPATTARAYLYRAVRNRALNAVRDRKPTAPLDALTEATPSQPDTHLAYRELLAAYRAAVAALPERRQQVFRLSRLYGLTYAEIAETLGVSINTVRTQMTAALGTMRERLGPLLSLLFF